MFEFGGFFWVAQKHDTSLVVEPTKVPKVLFWGGENSTPYQHKPKKCTEYYYRVLYPNGSNYAWNSFADPFVLIGKGPVF